MSFLLTYTHTGDIGLRGPVGEPGIKGTKGDQGDFACTYVFWCKVKFV